MSLNPFSGRIVKFPASPRRAGRRRGKEEREAHRREARAHLRIQRAQRGRERGFPFRGTVGAVLVLSMFALLMSGEYFGLLAVGLLGLCLLAWSLLGRGRRPDPVQ